MHASMEKVSAITLKVRDMQASLRFYRDVVGLELLYGGGIQDFPPCAFRTPSSQSLTCNTAIRRPAGGESFFTSQTWMHSGGALRKEGSVRTSPRMLPGENVTYSFTIPTVTRFPSHGHSRYVTGRRCDLVVCQSIGPHQ